MTSNYSQYPQQTPNQPNAAYQQGCQPNDPYQQAHQAPQQSNEDPVDVAKVQKNNKIYTICGFALALMSILSALVRGPTDMFFPLFIAFLGTFWCGKTVMDNDKFKKMGLPQMPNGLAIAGIVLGVIGMLTVLIRFIVFIA